MKKWIMIAMTACGFVAQATVVNFDLSTSYNYDAYVTGEEIANNINVDGTLGDHTLLKSVAGWAHLVDPGGATYHGIPSTTINGGEFELAAGLTGDKFGTATGTTKVNNTVADLSTDGSLATVRTKTVMLEAAQQGNYSDFNVLMTANRYGTRTVTMTALIEVKYVGDANWYAAWTESQVPSAGEPGGCFGGGFNSPTGTDSHQSTNWTAVIVNADVSNGIYKNTAPASGLDYMYKLAVAPTVDPLKTLEGFRFTASTTDQNRYNDFALYAISGTTSVDVPVPAILSFDNTTPAQFVQNNDVTTNLSFVVRNDGSDATNVTVSLTGNPSYTWLTVDPTTNAVALISGGGSDTSVFSISIASNAPAGVYADALTLNMTGTGTNGVPVNSSAVIGLEVVVPVVSDFMVDLSGNWNSNTNGNMNYTLPTPTISGTAIMYNDGFATPLLTNGQAGAGGGSYDGQTIYGAFRQQNNSGAPVSIANLRSGSGDVLNGTANNTNALVAGELNFMYVFKKADFYNGLDTVNVGFNSASTFSATTAVWTADSKTLRAVVQNGSTWYISQESNTVPQASVAKTIVTNAASALWAVWDPTTDISAASLNFTTTVAGSTFTNIQAVGIWASMIDGTLNPDFSISSIQIGGVAAGGGPPPVTSFDITSVGIQAGGGGLITSVGFDGSAGPTYALQFKTNLVTGVDWADVVTGTVSPLVYTNLGSSAAGYYRVQAQ